jgi:hypothetical protein
MSKFGGTSVQFTRSTRCQILEDGILHSHLCENLKAYMSKFILLPFKFWNYESQWQLVRLFGWVSTACHEVCIFNWKHQQHVHVPNGIRTHVCSVRLVEDDALDRMTTVSNKTAVTSQSVLFFSFSFTYYRLQSTDNSWLWKGKQTHPERRGNTSASGV